MSLINTQCVLKVVGVLSDALATASTRLLQWGASQ